MIAKRKWFHMAQESPADNQRLPLFALLGTNSPRVNKWIRQIPPTWSLWLDAFRLLVEHGASVHEINSNKSLVHLNISHGSLGPDRDYPEPSALQFFQILRDQCFMDFNLPGPDLWNPVLTAIRRKTQSIETLKFLSDAGVDLSRIAANGHSSLHWAAEMASEAECIEYLCSTRAIENINRQDSWGWTPLHYAVSSGRYGYRDAALDKVKCLLHHGADPELKAKRHPIFFVRANLIKEFTPLQLSFQIDSGLSTSLGEEIDEMKAKVFEESSDEIFFEAMEVQS
jgi:Ankyrin repeats (3 copies)